MPDPYRIVVVEDDADVALYTKTVLEKRAGCAVATVSNPFDARATIAEFKPDVVITDIEMPGMTGLQLIEETRVDHPAMPIVVMTAYISTHYADASLIAQADDFLLKPISSADLVAVVTRLAEASRARQTSGVSRVSVLAIGANVDDVEAGLGGTLARHRASSESVAILILSGHEETPERERAAAASAEQLGARLILDSLVSFEPHSQGATAKAIEAVVAEIEPTIVYTHSAQDSDEGHRAIFSATQFATRSVPAIASYQNRTSTIDFHPNQFVEIDDFMETKLSLLSLFESPDVERPYLDSDTVMSTARYWGRYVDGHLAEPLEMIRDANGPTAP